MLCPSREVKAREFLIRKEQEDATRAEHQRALAELERLEEEKQGKLQEQFEEDLANYAKEGRPRTRSSTAHYV